MRSDTSITARPRPEPTRAGVTLDAFAHETTRADGVRLRDLGSFDSLHFRTRNSHYRLWVLNPLEARVLIQGGAFFREPVEATVAGATAGGSMLKVGWILEGFNLEVFHEGQRIITTPVHRIHVGGSDSLPGPF